MKHIVIPSQVEMIEYRAFCDCAALESIVFENPGIRIEHGAFVGCVSIDEDTARFIEEHTFNRTINDVRSATPGPAGRLSEDYQKLLDRLYDAVYEQDAAFRDDLAQVWGHMLSHRLGRCNPEQTILTRQELTSRLELLSLRTGLFR